jgi:predicted MFS family arabinose efflux permease
LKKIHEWKTMGEKQPKEKMLIPALVISRLATQPPGILTGLLLIDIGLTFEQSVGVISQIRTSSSLISLVFALFMGILSIKYKHKTLLVTGTLLMALSSLGCYISPNFSSMLLAYSLTGIGMAMIGPMSMSLVGEHLPKEKRSKAIGWIIAGLGMITFIGSLVISYLDSIGGWRFAFLGFALPIALAAIIFAYLWIPKSEEKTTSSMGITDLFRGFQRVFSNRSATACLIGETLTMTTWMANNVFISSFFRQQFGLETGTVAMLIMVISPCFIGGSLLAGRIVNSFGRKKLTVLSVTLVGVLTVLYLNVSTLSISLIFACVTAVFGGMRATTTNSLTLEQIPEARGTLMSLSSAATSLGSTFGAAIGGYLLLRYGYAGLGVGMGAVGILGALVFAFLTIDPV